MQFCVNSTSCRSVKVPASILQLLGQAEDGAALSTVLEDALDALQRHHNH